MCELNRVIRIKNQAQVIHPAELWPVLTVTLHIHYLTATILISLASSFILVSSFSLYAHSEEQIVKMKGVYIFLSLQYYVSD